jgi:gliding motility-associated-like protein
MKTIYLFVFFIIFLCFSVLKAQHHPSHSDPNQTFQPSQIEKTPKLPNSLRFIENQNQWDKSILYRADIPSGNLLIKKNAFQYVFYDYSLVAPKHSIGNDFQKPAHQPQKIKGHSFEVQFLNANPHSTAQGLDEKHEKFNYFAGNNPAHWASSVKAYQILQYKAMYQGIDVKMYEKQAALKYEFVVAPQADTRQIKLAYKGAKSLKIKDNNLIIETTVNTVMEKKPYSYQIIQGKTIEVITQFRLKGNVLSFEFPNGYDKNYPLVIDPELVFSTYSGVPFDNWGFTATYDTDGNLYSGGILFFSTTGTRTINIGSFSATSSGQNDILILKFNKTGTAIDYITLLGGSVVEFPHSLVVDKDNNLVILGTTGSSNFPTTSGAFDRIFNGGTSMSTSNGHTFSSGSDIFIAKLNPAGNLIHSTFIGGTGNDGLNLDLLRNYSDEVRGDIYTDENNFIYVATATKSVDFPIVGVSSLPVNQSVGSQDAIVMKLPPDLSNIVWSTALGGTADESAFSIKLDANQDVFVCGATNGSNFPTTSGVLHPSSLGSHDGFITKLNNDGLLLASTYIGTVSQDQLFFLDIDPIDGNIYTMGLTKGLYPVSNGVYRDINGNQFIQKISADLTTSLLSTTFGSGKGTADISPTAFLVNDCGQVYIAGWGADDVAEQVTTSFRDNLTTANLTHLITTDAVKKTTDGRDFFLLIFQKDLSSVFYGSFLGSSGSGNGDHVDGGTCRFDKQGIVYHAVCGCADSGFPTTTGAVSAVNRGMSNGELRCNNAVFKFDVGKLNPQILSFEKDFITQINNACEFPIQVILKSNTLNATAWEWKIDGQVVGTNSDTVLVQFLTNDVYEISLTVSNPEKCIKPTTITKAFPVSVVKILDITAEQTICRGNTTLLEITYDDVPSAINDPEPQITWTPMTGLTIDSNDPRKAIAMPIVTTTYKVTVQDINGCTSSKEVKVNVLPPLPAELKIADNFNTNIIKSCLPTDAFVEYDTTRTDVVTWEISGGSLATPIIIQDAPKIELKDHLNTPGEYTIHLVAKRFTPCLQEIEDTKTIEIVDMNLQVSGKPSICLGDSTRLSAQITFTPDKPNATLQYTWTPSIGLSNPNIANPWAFPSTTTTYTVKVKSDEFLCEKQGEIKIEVIPEIFPKMDLKFTTDCGQPTVMTFINETTTALSFEWTITHLTDFTVPKTVLSEAIPQPFAFPKGGEYEVMFRAFTGECEEIETRNVKIEDNLTAPPNVITPNGDGKNDFFKISDVRPHYQLQIYNRWGGLLFESADYQDTWNARDVESGTYYYFLISPTGVKCRGWIQVFK